MKKVAIIMGSDSDLPVVSKAFSKLDEYGVPYEVHVFSAHRTPEETKAFTENAADNGFGVIIAAAGMAAHLAGAIAANTTLPVIGIPVATVAINGAANAALLSVQILALTEKELSDKLKADRIANREKILAKNADVSAKYSKN